MPTKVHLYTSSFACLTVVLIVCTLGCNRIDEKILASSESILESGIADLKNYRREGNDWLYEYLTPGRKRGLEVLRKVRREGRNITAMMSAGLTLDSDNHNGHITVHFIHPPGYTIIEGIYFLTTDGNKHEYPVVIDHDHLKRATWLRYISFAVEVGDDNHQKSDHIELEGWVMKPIRISNELLNSAGIQVGLILPENKYSDTVPVCIAYQENNKVSSSTEDNNNQK